MAGVAVGVTAAPPPLQVYAITPESVRTPDQTAYSPAVSQFLRGDCPLIRDSNRRNRGVVA